MFDAFFHFCLASFDSLFVRVFGGALCNVLLSGQTSYPQALNVFVHLLKFMLSHDQSH